MAFLKFLESIRTPFGDWLMSAITHLGEETLFLVIALLIFWCIDKRQGYFLLFAGYIGTICIQILKMSFRIPRPWVRDPSFTIVESAKDAATGYSFPSGHTQISATLYGGLARSAKQRTIRITGAVLCILIAFSRMYLGVHTPADVLVSLAIGITLVLVLYPIMQKATENPKVMYAVIGVTLLLALGNLLFVELYAFPADVDAVNLADAITNAWKLFFVCLGMCVLYPMDHHVIKFQTDAVWWAQILKLAGGVILVVAVRILLKAPLDALFDGHPIGGGIRYFLMVIVAGVLWPMTFRFFGRLGRK